MLPVYSSSLPSAPASIRQRGNIQLLPPGSRTIRGSHLPPPWEGSKYHPSVLYGAEAGVGYERAWSYYGCHMKGSTWPWLLLHNGRFRVWGMGGGMAPTDPWQLVSVNMRTKVKRKENDVRVIEDSLYKVFLVPTNIYNFLNLNSDTITGMAMGASIFSPRYPMS